MMHIYKEKNLNFKLKKNYRKNYRCKLIQIFLIILIICTDKKLNIIFEKNYNKNIDDNYYLINKDSLNYDTARFMILTLRNPICGLFCFYTEYLGCFQKYINLGYIPIFELISFPNMFNGFHANSSNENPWEVYFNQPFGYTLKDIKKNAKIIKYRNCKVHWTKRPNGANIYINKILQNYWHNVALMYMPIKEIILNECNRIINKKFKGSKNVLGVLVRGTDYLTRKPRHHAIQPNTTDVIKDIKSMNKKYNYDYIFLATEDELIKNKFMNTFHDKLKFIKSNIKINYNYKKKSYLALNKDVKGNKIFNKNYLLNIIILSKCIDLICSRTNGSVGVFVLTNGFRNTKVYYIGNYK